MRTTLFFILLSLFSPLLLAEVNTEIGFESRYFFEQGLNGQQKSQPSIRGKVEYDGTIGNDDINLTLFGRYDFQDIERRHFDIREATWTHVADTWELTLGIDKVFWGVTESLHLVDVINQSDLVENIDGEDKLGQPMAKFSTERSWGVIDAFWLPYFRERTFPGTQGRLSPFPIDVDASSTQYESKVKQSRSDFAIRYSNYIGDLDFAISHFSGTSREPIYVFNFDVSNPRLLPVYNVVDQTGLELQYIYDDWLWKFEGITNAGLFNKRYSAAVFGFEYTQVGILESSADLGWILEYMFDDSNNLAHVFERDIFAGWRYAFNDADSSEILAGFVYDPVSQEVLYSLEMNKRLADDVKINIEARVFAGAERAPNLKTAVFRDEDYIQLELVKYF